MSHDKITSDLVFKNPAPASHGTVTTGRRTLHISGQVGQAADGKTVGVGDVGRQTEQALDNLKAIVEKVGGSLSDVCRLVVYLLSRDDLAKVIEVRRRYFKEPFPAVTALIVSGLANPEWLVEIEGTAVLE